MSITRNTLEGLLTYRHSHTFNYFDDVFDELRFARDFLAVEGSFVRSTILLFLIT